MNIEGLHRPRYRRTDERRRRDDICEEPADKLDVIVYRHTSPPSMISTSH